MLCWTGLAVPAQAEARDTGAVSPTPYLGWNTYYGLGGDFTEDEVREVADALVDRGLRDAGYDIVWLDGGWQDERPRGEDGVLRADPDRFPSGLPALTDYLHDRGLRAGIYTDAGPYLPGSCGLGSHGHYQTDADTFAAWGFDAVKVDFLCGIAADLDPKTVFTEFSEALANNSSGRKLIFNLCNPVTSPDWGDYPEEQQSTYSWSYAPEIATSWRTYTDVGFVGAIKYADVLRNFDANARHPEVAGPGRWNDPDYLGPELGMTAEEFRTQFALWAVAAAPMIIASDVRTLDQDSLDTLTDPEVLAINQDPLGKQATRVGPAGDHEVWVKPLADGSRAVLLLNRGDEPALIDTTAADVGLTGHRFSVTDAWSDRVAETAGTVAATVPAHGTALFTVAPATGRPAAPLVITGPASVSTIDGAPAGAGTDPLVTAGAELAVSVPLHNLGRTAVRDLALILEAPEGWSATPIGEPPARILPGHDAEVRFRVVVSDDAATGPAEVRIAAEYGGAGGTGRSGTTTLPVTIAESAPTGQAVLSHHPWVSATSGWMTPAVDQAIGGGPIIVDGATYPTGIGVASVSTVRYYLGGACDRLTGIAGVDDNVDAVGPDGGTVTFTVIGDGRTLFESGSIARHTTVPLDVDVAGVRDLRLVVGDDGDGGYNDRAAWGDLIASCR
ncbi:NPCBM/NEW2 domain-containing protein [Microlunatus speluncae]|uniref:NPCBM/NEW2 domain-containing protein n=1 Tax=Microlunatus speluncae TaxID=2594267 RepID=UPI00126613EA